MRKRFLYVFALLLPMLLSGCGNSGGSTENSSGTYKSYNVNSSDTNSEKNNNSSSNGNGSTNSGESDAVTSDIQTNSDVPTVYMTTDISPEGMMAVYNALGWHPTGKVTVKLSTGEPPASNYLRPELIKDLVQSVNGMRRKRILTEPGENSGCFLCLFCTRFILTHEQ